MEARAVPAAAVATDAVANPHDAAAAPNDQLMVDPEVLAKFEDGGQLTGTRQKREDEEDEVSDEGAQKKPVAAGKHSRRHNWKASYEMEFGLLAIERDAVSGDVVLAMCGFCKAFGREGRYEQLVQADTDSGNENKKRRRRSLTTTKFFRTYRVDNIRSHLQNAHPRRWAEYELLPKQEPIRARFLQLHGDLQYDQLPMVDDVVLGSSAESDMAYVQAQAHALAQASAISDVHQHAAAAHAAQVASSTGLNGGGMAQLPASLLPTPSDMWTNRFFGAASGTTGSRGTFDYEKHLTEQIALDRERLEFEKARFKKEVELRERELALREKHMEQEATLHEKLCEANRENAQQESAKFYRLAEVLRDAIASAQNPPGAASVV
ncbi:hypothetical protein BBJ28_00017885 [Nothophytophthora sp. Chile5]|nr:hypothetical protein BBJ28_00017885 [Nothophytophthora sp. Chile5]